MIDIPFRSKELSWLSFNARVLQEADSDDVPLLERLTFLGIYSSNLDEFFRVRVATLRRLINLHLPHTQLGIPDPEVTLTRVNSVLKRETKVFNHVYHNVFRALEAEGIRLVTDQEVPQRMHGYLNGFFEREVLPHLMPISIKSTSSLGGLKDHPMYLAVRMSKSGSRGRPHHSLIEIPQHLPRFHVLPQSQDEQLVMYVDDVIRFGLHRLFESLPYDHFESFALKFTRDAEIELDNDITESFYEQVADALKAREGGLPVRINYDAAMPRSFLKLVIDGLDATGDEDSQFPGARYHNRKDLMHFPTMGRHDLHFPKFQTVVPAEFRTDTRRHLLKAVRERDILLHYPYHSFEHFLDLLRQVSLDPLVKSISLTQYRIAKNSAVARALLSAVRNGKEVTVLVEPTARFDEEANLQWARLYAEAGIRVILGVQGLKVHAKLCLIERLEKGVTRTYSCVGTGNFNESTAKLYTDHMLLTYNQEIGSDLHQIFQFFRKNYETPRLRHLIFAPFDLRRSLFEFIDFEIDQATQGRPAEIWIKINNLSDVETVRRLYQAAQAGVDLRLIVRSMYSLVNDEPGHSESVHSIGIVDRLLEHTRILVFHHGGNRRYFLSSADFLPRNFERRCESLCPILDPRLQRQLQAYLDLQWRDNVKARCLDADLSNAIRNGAASEPRLQSQVAIRDYLETLTRSPGTSPVTTAVATEPFSL